MTGWPMSDELEEQAKIRAYELWELAGKPFRDDDKYWQDAVAELKFLRARQELETRIATFKR